MLDMEYKCLGCGQLVEPGMAVRQGPGAFYGMEAHIVNIGFRCPACGHEWGFEEER